MGTDPNLKDSICFDVVIVGSGPSGLSAAIRIKQIDPKISVIVLEKGSSVGSHILSGAIMDPIGIDILFPNWRNEKNPFNTPVKKETMIILTEKRKFLIPKIFIPKMLSNKNCFVVSLGNFCQWLSKKAEELGVEIYPGFSGMKLLYNTKNAVIGIITGSIESKRGVCPSETKLMSKYILIAEGARGSLAQELIEKYNLGNGRFPQKYGIGLKEIWEINPNFHNSGFVQHNIGWPLDNYTTGGSFIYHMNDNKISVGLIVHLDYKNPYLSPFEEFQRFKTHPFIKTIFKGGKRLSYGARVISVGGFQSIPKVTFPGGVIIGCSAGFVNVPRLKGSHNAILSGIFTAEKLAYSISKGKSNDDISLIEDIWKDSLIGKDLFLSRNFKPLWEKFGTRFGIFLGGFDLWCQELFGKSFFGSFNHQKIDSYSLDPSKIHKKINYPKHDNILTFDCLSSVYLSNNSIFHKKKYSSHLEIKSKDLHEKSEFNIYGGPSTYYCPANVYEWIQESGKMKYIINAHNCIHCKTCDIKDPNQNIKWKIPEGGLGPNYFDM